MNPYDKSIRIRAIGLLACGVASVCSCKQIKHDGRPFVVTQNNIEILKIAIIDLDKKGMRDLKEYEGSVFSVSDVILDPSIKNGTIEV